MQAKPVGRTSISSGRLAVFPFRLALRGVELLVAFAAQYFAVAEYIAPFRVNVMGRPGSVAVAVLVLKDQRFVAHGIVVPVRQPSALTSPVCLDPRLFYCYKIKSHQLPPFSFFRFPEQPDSFCRGSQNRVSHTTAMQWSAGDNFQRDGQGSPKPLPLLTGVSPALQISMSIFHAMNYHRGTHCFRRL